PNRLLTARGALPAKAVVATEAISGSEVATARMRTPTTACPSPVRSAIDSAYQARRVPATQITTPDAANSTRLSQIGNVCGSGMANLPAPSPACPQDGHSGIRTQPPRAQEAYPAARPRRYRFTAPARLAGCGTQHSPTKTGAPVLHWPVS